MQEMDLSPDDIRTIDDIVKLPFTTKQDLRDNYPYGLQLRPLLKLCGCMPLLELQEIRRLLVIRVGPFYLVRSYVALSFCVWSDT